MRIFFSFTEEKVAMEKYYKKMLSERESSTSAPTKRRGRPKKIVTQVFYVLNCFLFTSFPQQNVYFVSPFSHQADNREEKKKSSNRHVAAALGEVNSQSVEDEIPDSCAKEGFDTEKSDSEVSEKSGSEDEEDKEQKGPGNQLFTYF